jgi:aminoglycoside phosphotransferase (APT) family kinase protein
VAGRSLDQVVGQVPRTEAERLVVAAGEVLARVHGAVADRGVRHELRPPDDVELDGVVRVVGDALGAGAAAVVARGAAFLHEEVERRPAPSLRLAHGDFLPKNLVVEADAIVAVIDWELAGPAPAAFDLARWEVSAGPPWHDRSDLLLEGYARTAGPEAAAADGLVPAYAVDWALEKLGWRNPAPLAQRRRCVDVIARYVGPGASA